MKESGWGGGYSTEESYTSGFYPEQAPEHLNYVCLLNGVEPVPLDRPYTYCELGCGLGATVTLLAASHPQGRFYAADFMPAHVAAARRRAESAALANLTFLENSFAELADGRVELPRFDFITMHGVYSWVSKENRRHIVRFIERHLKPGGLVYVSYNALPGWATALPMRRLMLSQAVLQPGSGPERIGRAQALLESLVEAQAGYFAANPGLPERFDTLKRGDRVAAYLVHEYLNSVAEPMYHADVAADLAPAKLDYVGSAIPSVAFQALPAAQQDLLDACGDPAWRETVRDFIINTRFRMDVYVRGRRPLPPRRRLERLRQCVLMLTVPRGGASLGIEGLEGPAYAGLQEEVLDALARAPQSFEALSRWPLFSGDVELVAQVSALMCGSLRLGAVTLASRAGVDPGPARRLNRLVTAGEPCSDALEGLACPLTGCGIKASPLERRLYVELSARPGDTDPAVLASRLTDVLEGNPADMPRAEGPAHEALRIAQVQDILENSVPLWRQLNAL